MGWESESIEHPCPCGQGTYTYTSESNDWGQSKSNNYQMHCPDCKERYVLAFDEYSAMRKKTDGWYWQRKEDYERQEAERRRRQEIAGARRKTIQPPTMDMSKEEIISILERELTKGSHSYGFNRSKSKKELIDCYYRGTAYLDSL